MGNQTDIKTKLKNTTGNGIGRPPPAPNIGTITAAQIKSKVKNMKETQQREIEKVMPSGKPGDGNTTGSSSIVY